MVYHRSESSYEVGLWRATESEQFFQEALDASDFPLEDLHRIRHPEKRKQWLASRYLLNELYPLSIQEYQDRKPILRNGPHLSISHSDDMVGVMLGEHSAGLDLQSPNEKLLRIAPRFVNDGELELLSTSDSLWAASLLWAIKEAVFKHYGTQMPFRKIALENYDPLRQIASVQAYRGDGEHAFRLHCFALEKMAVAYLCD